MPIGYVLASGLFGSSEVMYNVFETFRGGESARIYGRVLSMARHLFGADTFAIDPFQLGHANPEGQKSGAFWFYYKLGFRPVDAEVLRLVREERRRLARHPRERSSPRTMHRLSAEYVFLHAAGPRRDVLGRCRSGTSGCTSRACWPRGSAPNASGPSALAPRGRAVLGVRSFGGWSAGERLAWERWSPLVLALDGVERWPAADRRALVRRRAGEGRAPRVGLRPALRRATARLRRAVLRLAARV